MFNHLSLLTVYDHSLPDGFPKLNELQDNWPQQVLIEGLPYTLEDCTYNSGRYLLDVETLQSTIQKLEAEVAFYQRALQTLAEDSDNWSLDRMRRFSKASMRPTKEALEADAADLNAAFEFHKELLANDVPNAPKFTQGQEVESPLREIPRRRAFIGNVIASEDETQFFYWLRYDDGEEAMDVIWTEEDIQPKAAPEEHNPFALATQADKDEVLDILFPQKAVPTDDEIDSLYSAKIAAEEKESMNRCPSCGGQLDHPDDDICYACYSSDPANDVPDYLDDSEFDDNDHRGWHGYMGGVW
jgi:hypothetical protein